MPDHLQRGAWQDRLPAARHHSYLLSQPVGCKSTVATAGDEQVLPVAALTSIGESLSADRDESQRFVQFSVGSQTVIRGDLTAAKLQLQATIKTDPQIVVFASPNGFPCHLSRLDVQTRLFKSVAQFACRSAGS